MDKENLIINGRYLVLENIGKGGAGEVFLARDIKNGRKYAIKRYISSNPNDRNQLIDNIERELNVLKYTTHPVLPKSIIYLWRIQDSSLLWNMWKA